MPYGNKNSSRMRQSLAGRELSTRLRNCLINMAAYVGGPAKWGDLIERYKHDPDRLHVSFLRTPGAGKASWNELVEALKPELHGLDYTGTVIWLNGEDVQRIKDSIDEACASLSPSVCNDLHAIAKFFEANTIHIEHNAESGS